MLGAGRRGLVPGGLSKNHCPEMQGPEPVRAVPHLSRPGRLGAYPGSGLSQGQRSPNAALGRPPWRVSHPETPRSDDCSSDSTSMSGSAQPAQGTRGSQVAPSAQPAGKQLLAAPRPPCPSVPTRKCRAHPQTAVFAPKASLPVSRLSNLTICYVNR